MPTMYQLVWAAAFAEAARHEAAYSNHNRTITRERAVAAADQAAKLYSEACVAEQTCLPRHH